MASTNGTHADSKVIWLNGKLTPYSEAVVPVLSHTLHYGTGAFEGIRAYELSRGGTAIFRAREHFVRLFDSMRALALSSPYTLDDYLHAAHDTVRANELKSCYIRPLVYLDDAVRGLKLPENPKVHSAIAVWPWGTYMGDEGMEKGIRVKVSSYRRADVASSLPWAKLTGAYLTSVMARREATKCGLDEAILLDPLGTVAEGSGENLFIVKDGILYTPPTTFILPGITRDSVMELAKHLGLPVYEASITRNQLYLADEVFFTGTAAEITPIREIDHRPVGPGKPGPITTALREAYFRCVRGELAEFRHWLSVVE